MDAEELALLNATLLGLAEDNRGGVLTEDLDAFGWRDVLAAHPHEAVDALFDAQGRTGTWSAALQDVLADDVDVLGVADSPNVVLPRPGNSCQGIVHDGRATIDGALLCPRDEAAPLVAAVTSALARPLIVAVDAHDMRLERRGGLDPGLGVVAVSGTTVKVTLLAEDDGADAWWGAAQARGRLALCRQIVAALAVMIEQARAHVSEREQFGQRVGTFQAVRHKLVEAHVATTAADCMTTTAWESDDLVLAAETAKVVTGRAVTLTAAHTQQLLAGVGFTAEHPYHHFLKRVLVLERILGSSMELAPDLGRRVIERGGAPRLVEL
jgi:hypothetical protein